MRILRKHENTQQKDSVSREVEHPFVSLREAMNRVFDESFWDPFHETIARFPGITRAGGFPKVDIAETEKEITITANLPNIAAEKVDIEVDNQSVTISGKIEREQEEKGKRFYKLEREYGEFRRAIPLPSPIKPDTVNAKMKQGVLTLILPKENVSSKIKVTAKAE